MQQIKENLKYVVIIVILIVFSIYTVVSSLSNKDENIKEEKIEKKEKIEEPSKKEDNYYYVDIKGAVNKEGVYKLKENARVIDAINASGGLKENADTSIINLSKKIKDEMYIIVYTKEETKKYREEKLSNSEISKKLQNNILTIDENNDANIKEEKTKEEKKDEIVNINIATKEDLLTITGIGESKAENIIKYREENGDYESIEDIKKVTGIGDSLFEKIKKYITV